MTGKVGVLPGSIIHAPAASCHSNQNVAHTCVGVLWSVAWLLELFRLRVTHGSLGRDCISSHLKNM